MNQLLFLQPGSTLALGAAKALMIHVQAEALLTEAAHLAQVRVPVVSMQVDTSSSIDLLSHV